MDKQHFRKDLKEILCDTVLLEGIPEKEMLEKLRPLRNHIDSHLPSRLFRYRSCSELNIDAFNEDKFYAVTPDKFNDPYDSLIRYDKEKLREQALLCTKKEYIVSLRNYFQSNGDFPKVLHTILPQELLDKVSIGHTYCNCFKTEDDKPLNPDTKNNRNFEFANQIFYN